MQASSSRTWTGTSHCWWYNFWGKVTLTEALARGGPEVFNTDQGSQFTSREFTQVLQDRGGKGRYADNIFVERLWRSVKYEEVHLKAYASGGEAKRELDAYFRFYNNQMPHQALGYRTPAEVYQHRPEAPDEKNPGRRWLEDPVVILDSGAAALSLNSAPILSN